MINWFFFVIYYHPRSQNTAPLAELHVSMTTGRGKNEVWYFILLDFKQIKVAMETHGLSCLRYLRWGCHVSRGCSGMTRTVILVGYSGQLVWTRARPPSHYRY